MNLLHLFQLCCGSGDWLCAVHHGDAPGGGGDIYSKVTEDWRVKDTPDTGIAQTEVVTVMY